MLKLLLGTLSVVFAAVAAASQTAGGVPLPLAGDVPVSRSADASWSLHGVGDSMKAFGLRFELEPLGEDLRARADETPLDPPQDLVYALVAPVVDPHLASLSMRVDEAWIPVPDATLFHLRGAGSPGRVLSMGSVITADRGVGERVIMDLIRWAAEQLGGGQADE